MTKKVTVELSEAECHALMQSLEYWDREIEDARHEKRRGGVPSMEFDSGYVTTFRRALRKIQDARDSFPFVVAR